MLDLAEYSAFEFSLNSSIVSYRIFINDFDKLVTQHFSILVPPLSLQFRLSSLCNVIHCDQTAKLILRIE